MTYFDMHLNTQFKIKIALEYFYAHTLTMARPRKKITKQRVTVTLSPALLEASQAYAYEIGESLSGLIERLLFETLQGAAKSSDAVGGLIGSIASNQQGGIIGKISVAIPSSPHNKNKI